jgi:hypothetical protein
MEPKTTIGARKEGGNTQAQMHRATRPNAKPEIPDTSAPAQDPAMIVSTLAVPM